MTTRKRWWWWVALVGAVVLVVAIPVSFRRVMGWTDSQSRWYLYIEHGVLHGNNIQSPSFPPPIRPSYGNFQFTSSPIYDPWVAFPSVETFGVNEWSFKLPLHFPFIALTFVVAWPYLPPIVKRCRRKAGLCVGCAYDLTGNESGVCPECGEAT